MSTSLIEFSAKDDEKQHRHHEPSDRARKIFTSRGSRSGHWENEAGRKSPWQSTNSLTQFDVCLRGEVVVAAKVGKCQGSGNLDATLLSFAATALVSLEEQNKTLPLAQAFLVNLRLLPRQHWRESAHQDT